MGIDLTGPLPKTSGGYRYIMTATDYFSKWVEAYPLKTKSATEVAENLCKIIYRHGCPARTLSGQGRKFVNQVSNHNWYNLVPIMLIKSSCTWGLIAKMRFCLKCNWMHQSHKIDQQLYILPAKQNLTSLLYKSQSPFRSQLRLELLLNSAHMTNVSF